MSLEGCRLYGDIRSDDSPDPDLQREFFMIRHIATGLVVAGLALAPTFAFAKTYKTEKTCVKHHLVWKDGKCHKA